MVQEFGMHRELVRVFALLNDMVVEPVEGLGGGQYRETHRIQIRVQASCSLRGTTLLAIRRSVNII
jgi:hypothetical protein